MAKKASTDDAKSLVSDVERLRERLRTMTDSELRVGGTIKGGVRGMATKTPEDGEYKVGDKMTAKQPTLQLMGFRRNSVTETRRSLSGAALRFNDLASVEPLFKIVERSVVSGHF
jgi:hypothetical protein